MYAPSNGRVANRRVAEDEKRMVGEDEADEYCRRVSDLKRTKGNLSDHFQNRGAKQTRPEKPENVLLMPLPSAPPAA